MKRLFSILALALCLGACTSDPTDGPDPEPIVEPEPEPEPEPDPEPEPTVYPNEFIAATMDITTEGAAPIVSKEDYVKCTVSLSHSGEKEWELADVPGGIRGRGNSSWLWYDKKPYRIKFDKKQSLMGLGKAKSWVLLAEYRDPTDLMNAFVFEFAQMMDMPYTNHNRYVEVTLNGDYIGLYHLTEQVQQGDNRVAVDEMAGYLIQLDRDDGPELAPDAGDNFWSEVYRMPVCVKNPEDLGAEGLAKAKAELATLETAIRKGDYKEVCKLIDIQTMIKFLIVQELVYNVELDAPRSMYMHKDVGGKWAMGPLWDFDAGFDFDWGTMTTGHNFFEDYRELVMGTNPATGHGTGYHIPGFFSELFFMPEFVSDYKTTWKRVSPMVTAAMDKAEMYYGANIDAFAREAKRWPIDRDYYKQIPRLRAWLNNRVVYLNNIVANY